MSSCATSWAWKQTVKLASEKLVLLSLADRAGDEHLCWPSVTRLERDTQLNRKTVSSCLVSLIKQGLLRDTGERRGSTKQVKVYQLIGVKSRDDNDTDPSSHKQNHYTKKQPRNTPKNDPIKATQNRDASEKSVTESNPILPIKEPKNGSLKGTQYWVTEPKRSLEPKKEPKRVKTRDERASTKTPKNQICFDNLPDQISIETAMAFVEHRKALKSPLTQYAFDKAMAEACRAPSIGLTPDEAIDQTILAGWKGINITWLQNRLSRTEAHPRAANTTFSDATDDISWAQDLGW